MPKEHNIKMFQVVRVPKIVPNGKIIKEKRLRLGLSLKQVADKAGVSVTYVSRIEHENINHVSKKVAKKITRILCRA